MEELEKQVEAALRDVLTDHRNLAINVHYAIFEKNRATEVFGDKLKTLVDLVRQQERAKIEGEAADNAAVIEALVLIGKRIIR